MAVRKKTGGSGSNGEGPKKTTTAKKAAAPRKRAPAKKSDAAELLENVGVDVVPTVPIEVDARSAGFQPAATPASSRRVASVWDAVGTWGRT